MALGREPRSDGMSARTTAIWLGLFVVLALVLRIAFNIGVAHDADGDRYLYSGNDPYYHDRTVNHILETGKSLTFDPAINYPAGAANPNPPLYDWTTAPLAGLFHSMGMSSEASVSLALNLMVAVWGALTVIPVFMIGRDLWGRKAGLWAGFFMAVSAPHMVRGMFGFADHDATTMFFITLALAFLVKALRALDHREYVSDWRHGAARMQGIRESFTHNRLAFTWAGLSGVALAATALTWKGYPYVLAVMAIAVALQLVWDHARNRDSTAVFGIYLVPLILVLLLPLPYYLSFPGFLDTTIMASVYVLIGVLVFGLILVPTRDLPSILVFPALAVASIVGLLLMLFVFKDVGQTVFSGLGYFQQNKLYVTISEAQRTPLGYIAASFGFFTFLLAFWGFGRAARRGHRMDSAMFLLVAWSVVAVFMAFAASRFVMNAAPVFAILSGAVLPTITAKLGFEEVRKRFRSGHGQGGVGRAFRSLTLRNTIGVLLVVLFLVLPNLWLGVDASMSNEFEQKHKDALPDDQVGAYGVDISIRSSGWLETMDFLASLDTDLPMEERPAFIAWWDYGHWATAVGRHPTVADNFQHHYGVAGRFLASESEQSGVMWLSILLINKDYWSDGTGYSPAVQAVLDGVDPALKDIGPLSTPDAEEETFRTYVNMTNEEPFELYDALMAATGHEIRYFGVDSRMFPSQGNPSIFYAPVFLADKDPEDFIQTQYIGRDSTTGQTVVLDLEQYAVDADGHSYQLDQPKLLDSNGDEWIISGGQAFRKDQPITSHTVGVSVQPRINPKQPFLDSMFYKAFGGTSLDAKPGDGLGHWRAIQESLFRDAEGTPQFRQVALLEYYTGVEVSGTVFDDGGAPMAGVQVGFMDGFGAVHGLATTADDGSYTARAPFAVDNDLSMVVQVDGTMVYQTNDTEQFSRADTDAGATRSGVDIIVPRGTFSGRVFRDLDGNGTFSGADTGVSTATVYVDDVPHSVASDGSFVVSGLQAGPHEVRVVAPDYQNLTQSITVPSGDMLQQDLALTPVPATVTVTLLGDDAVDGKSIDIVDTTTDTTIRTASTNATGMVSVSLPPGSYEAVVDTTFTSDSGVNVHYDARQAFTVAFGGDPVSVTLDARS